MEGPIIRLSVLRCDAEAFPRFRAMMEEAEAALRPGIEAMRGLLAYYAGADPAALALSNVSIWQTLADAQQMDDYAPMQEQARRFAAAGARFDRPIMNHAALWRFGPNAIP